MPFDTERFITEIQNRPCLWNINNEEYSNRVIKQSAWNEIAEILYNDWQHLEENIKTKKVQDMQKKWKGLRDYHNRERNKDSSLRSGSGAPKKRKTPFLDMLNFLNITKKKDPTSGKYTDINTCTDDVHHYETVPEESNSSAKPKKMSVFQEALLKSMEKKREDDPDMNFLLNILPEMKSMTPSQNFGFRFEVMKIIKNIKYNTENDYSGSCFPEQPGCSYPYQYGYTNGPRFSSVQNSPPNSNNSVVTSIEDQNVQNSPSNNSVASSVEDIKAIKIEIT